ncbi:MAG TPA: VPLPA-CTERM sorting domain-containing protein [Spongiibacteraceae bacterium]|nr:VPLPA-CTERM sorting domain-containing protein [Spongiibacteraceae bacterium]
MKKLALFTALATGLFAASAHAALYDRGNGMIYDNVLNITWLQDANFAKTSGYDSDGLMTWAAANAWAQNLGYGGYDDWRLPVANLANPASPCSATNGSCDIGYNNIGGELGYMFYVNLGNKGYVSSSGTYPQPGYGLKNVSFTDTTSGATVSFLNLLADNYWYDEHTTYAAWVFGLGNGYQGTRSTTDGYYAWAVRDGDVGQVPIPAAAWLFGSALFGMAGVTRKHR